MSLRVRHVLSAQGAFDYATNSGNIYDLNLGVAGIADETVRRAMWRVHIETLILGAYAREFKEPTTCITPDDFEKLADMLQSYYAEHIRQQRDNAILMKLFKGEETRYAQNMKEFMAAAPKKE